MKRTRLFTTIAQILLDLVAIYLAFVFAYLIRDVYTLNPGEFLGSIASRLSYNPNNGLLGYESYYHYIRLIIPSMAAVGAMAGLYRISPQARWWERFARIFFAITVGSFFILFLFFLKKDFFLPRLLIMYSWVISIIAVFLSHTLINTAQKLLYRFGVINTRLAVLGMNKTSTRVIQELTGAPDSPYTLVWHGPGDASLADIENALISSSAEELVVIEDKDNEHLVALREVCLEHQITFRYLPILFTQLPSTYAVHTVRDMPMIEVKPTPLDGWGQISKRLFDLIVGTAMLIVASPIFIVIAIGVKLTSPGPLFFGHKRIGRGKKTVKTWKFRTFRKEFCDEISPDYQQRFQAILDADPALAQEWEHDHKLKNDPRVYPLGRILRKTSLDELPQLFNVIGGSLSLVGPRPIVQDEVNKYGKRAKYLFSIKPGLTGLWQVSGRNDVSYEDRVNMDMFYIEHWNIWQDIVILLKTFWVLVIDRSRGGAY